jgi:hypothetical protein
MVPELIVMLTYNDKTVENALELFDELKHTPVKHWGFKDVGLTVAKMGELVTRMKEAGKTTYLEVVSLSEAEGLAGARLAVELGFDILMGTVFFDSINDYLRNKSPKYYPFPGHVHSHPSILDGSMDEIVAHGRYLESRGVDGMDLLAYRYTGDAPLLLARVVSATRLPVVSAGSIASFDRILEVWRAGAWGFTIGTAFFEKCFVPGSTLEDNVMAVCDWLRTREVSL